MLSDALTGGRLSTKPMKHSPTKQARELDARRGRWDAQHQSVGQHPGQQLLPARAHQ